MIRRTLLSALLGRLQHGQIEIVESGARRCFGPPDSLLRATIEVRDPSFWRALGKGSLGLGSSYAGGLWDCDDLVTLVRIGAREMPRLDRFRAPLAPLRNALTRVPRNTRSRARRHIAAHYDMGNDLFELFLDETMTYSCGVWPSPEMTLREAQDAKLDMACRKLELTPDDHLLEIGSGWGSLALHAARSYGCRVTTTTLSREQHAAAAERVRSAGLEGQGGVAPGLSRAARPLLEARLHRDGRGRGLAVLRPILLALLRAAGPRWPDAPPGDHHRWPGVRGREGLAKLRQRADLSRWLPALPGRDPALHEARDRHAGPRRR